MESKQINPIQDLFIDIEKILAFMEIKDQRRADSYETTEIRAETEVWMGAVQEKDTYLTYRNLWTVAMFQEIVSNVKINNVQMWMNKPHNVPLIYQDNLRRRGREAFLMKHVEGNQYYRMINGLPPIDTLEKDYIYLSEPLRNQIIAPKNVPVHELSLLLQNRLISTDEYKELLKEHPDKEYLRYLGVYKIDIFTARKARDFEIIRYHPMNRSDINPNLLREFASLYNDYRDYVIQVLYNRHLEDVFENYRTFMGVLIQCFVLMQISNKAQEAITNRRFLDDNVLHIILSMHGIPSTLLMTKEVRRNLVINLLKLTREKATDDVYYSLVQILGYHDVIISKLMLMRGQEFDPDSGQAKFADGTEITNFEDMNKILTFDSETGEYKQKLAVDPHFVQVDLLDPDPYDTIVNGNAPIHDYHKIVDNDPTWWDLEDTQNLLRNTHYTIADSKYIMVEAVIHQIRYLFEAIYFTRLILDNKIYTDRFNVQIPEIFGTEPVSVYDLMVFILSATCINNNLRGEIVGEEVGLYATAGFNFDLDLDLFKTFLDTTKYVDKEKIIQFIDNLSMETSSDINRLFNDVMYPMREWLEQKIANTSNRNEFIEYEMIYRALYTYDISHNSFLEDYQRPMEIIQERYNLSQDEIIAYQHFYPHTYTGEAITKTDFVNSKYIPFLPADPITWYIDIPFKGTLYFYDILNCPDLRELKSEEGVLLFIDDFEEIDREAVRDAINAIQGLRDDELRNAFFKEETPILNSNGKRFLKNERLPAMIRNEVFKNILIDKIQMDLDGLAVPPTTYEEYLSRKNKRLYTLLVGQDHINDPINIRPRYETDKVLWMEDVMTIVLALETELNLHMKYFEQSIVGPELFFKPLITLINHFKSTFVHFAKTGLKYVFGDKMDTGGNSNMFKLFDSMATTIHFVLLSKRGTEAQFGFYDTEHRATYKILMKDRSTMMRLTPEGEFDVENRRSWMGSIRLVDEMKIFLNGEPIDPSGHTSSFYSGEANSGRFEDDSNHLMRTRLASERIINNPIDTEAWKEHVESYNPN